MRLQKYFDLHKFFLKDCDSIDALIEECRLSQIYLGELIELKLKIQKEYAIANRKYENQVDIYRDNIFDALKKRGVSATESVIKAKIEALYGDNLEPLRSKKDELKIESECVQDLYYAMIQRKDILIQIIDRWKFKDEYESCLLKNKEFIQYIKRGI